MTRLTCSIISSFLLINIALAASTGTHGTYNGYLKSAPLLRFKMILDTDERIYFSERIYPWGKLIKRARMECDGELTGRDRGTQTFLLNCDRDIGGEIVVFEKKDNVIALKKCLNTVYTLRRETDKKELHFCFYNDEASNH